MSFQHKSLWLPRDSGCFAGENLGYENSSRVEQKRDHQWFMNTGEPETFSNKKQAVEAIGGNPFSGVSHVNVSPWDTNSGFHSVTGQFSDRLFGSDPRRAINLVDKNLLSTGSGSLNVARRDVENQFRNEQSSGLSRSHAIADTSSDPNFGGIRKVKVNQVRDSYNLLPASIGHPYSRADSSTISIGTGHNRNDANISLGSAYNNGNDNIIAMVSGISNTNNNSISMDRPFNKADGSFMLMNQKYGLSMSQPFNRADFVPMDQSYSKGHENFIPTGPTYSKPGENFINISPFYGKGLENLVSMGPTYISTDSNIPPTLTPFETGNSSSFLAGHNYNKGVSGTMPFIAFTSNPESNPSGGITNGYNLLMGDQINPNAEQPVNNTQTANTQIDTTQKNKEKKTKKASSNNFPSNVKSLLSTGIFDGVVVKYVSWSREKSLGAVIKGTGYVCSCDDCKESKCLNAYEFERHAGAKTKHPNNHIYFENGKTVYGVVQELKNTPQEMLFDAIQNVTGTTINEKNFSSWKASYQAATKELQRIYGADEVIITQS
ncbi:hypothetical protein HN51_068116 [Arachis hypogaea]|uniref:Tify domain-containing protein n=2 Tax=Arachis TaxID=3817 RepID=A0A445DAC9_ARAHY|nr:probable WRKY transcription factor protein 1 isoform X1 [Arachis ipaensis]XP_025650393.1 probable WRKY transcription factor protein 1 isoform X1 [Arachis hypogaea]XP_025650394.1 probable WRKY transcription factor protein 1 isoform X1 [Arachis hypogaea]XP_025697116.1 probable WRKY transcription factor protein 1 isoform X1 [Arachis hypogaea]XP_025697117.1 probable WRKY transcription factor protein 1 isoform X1 [Arachis hypogaea]QHO09860.1 uncharacterized protein DS421_14g484840 [Arachis hypog